MIYEVLQPCDELKDVISHFWVGTWDENSQESNSVHYIIANSLTEMTFAFRKKEEHAELLFSSVQGHTHQPNQYPVQGFYHLFGVSFYSYAIPELFNLSAYELNGEHLSLNTFLGNEGENLNERIALASSTQERVKILTNYFKQLLNKGRTNDNLMFEAVKRITECNGNTKVIELSKEFSLSQKQFGRRFKEFSGFSPKKYARIIRFESFIKNYSLSTNFTEAACASGYFDQAHLIHEFKEFTGFNPLNFFRLSEENL